MMETIKRHAFLLGLAAGVVVILLAVVLMVYFVYVSPNEATRRMLTSTRSRAMALGKGKLFSEDLVNQMAEQVARRKKQYDELLGYVKSLGAARKPLIEGLFPTSTDVNVRHRFKAAYDEALGRFMKRLGAGTPTLPVRTGRSKSGKGETDDLALAEVREKYLKFTMFAHPKQSFERPSWVDDPKQPPSPEESRFGQEDIWLMEDLVETIARMNDDVLKNKNATPVVANAPVKELIEISIGCGSATLSSAKMQSTSERYRPVYTPAARGGSAVQESRAPTLSGRYSKNGFYRVLPWRLAVVVEGRYAGELIRRLKGGETFLSVEAWSMNPITANSFEQMRNLTANLRDDYGKQGIAYMEVVGESLVFQLAGGRVTTLVTAAKPTDAEAAEKKDGQPATTGRDARPRRRPKE